MIIFLDMDGTLHPLSRCGGLFSCRPALEAVLRAHPNVQVVISSDWRIQHSLLFLQHIFSEDVRPQVVGVTPSIDGLRPHKRHAEIQRWIQQNGYQGDWIALDDDADAFEPGCPNLVLVDSDVGFAERAKTELLRRLGARAALATAQRALDLELEHSMRMVPVNYTKNVLAHVGKLVMTAAQGRPELIQVIFDAVATQDLIDIELKVLTNICQEQREAKPIEDAVDFSQAMAEILRKS